MAEDGAPARYGDVIPWYRHGRLVLEIYDEVRKLAPDAAGQKLVLRVHPGVARALRGEEAAVVKSLQALTGGELTVHADALLHQEQFDVVAV